jgi:hypothetical protein
MGRGDLLVYAKASVYKADGVALLVRLRGRPYVMTDKASGCDDAINDTYFF